MRAKRNLHRPTALLLLSAISTLSSIAAAAPVPQYQILNIGDIAGGVQWNLVHALALNNAGEVVGSLAQGDSDFPVSGFKYSEGVLSLIPPPPGECCNSALDISDSGAVTGEYGVHTPAPGGYLYADGFSRNLGSLIPNGITDALLVNDAGQVTGRSEVGFHGSGKSHAFLYDPITGKMKNLGSPDGSDSYAATITASGQVSMTVSSRLGPRAWLYDKGTYTALAPIPSMVGRDAVNKEGYVVLTHKASSNEDFHAFLYFKGRLTDLGTFGGATSSPVGINDAHEVVGNSFTATGELRTFLYSNGRMKDLTLLARTTFGSAVETFPVAINNLGYVVLAVTPASGGLRFPAVYKKGQIIPIKPLRPAKSTDVFEWAEPVWINDHGQVAGYVTFPGGRSFIATPISLLFQRLYDATQGLGSGGTLTSKAGSAWTAYAKYDVSTSDKLLVQFIADVKLQVSQRKVAVPTGDKLIAAANAIKLALQG